MICDVIIDGNFVLNKLVFTLHKNNLLFGGLYKGLEMSVAGYRKWYPFANVFLVSDSKEKSWRKKLNTNYKANRKKDSDIDWEFVFATYNEFKEDIRKKNVKIMEAPHIEGDDWISFLMDKANREGRSTIVVSNDHDIKQLVTYSVDPLWINIMTNEIQNKQKLFLPKNYQIFLNRIKQVDSDDIFNLNDSQDFVRMIDNFIKRYEVIEVDSMESLIVKVISGDNSDNISSVWQVVKNGKKRGIADKGAKTIFDEYLVHFGEPKLNDPDLTENIADLICEKKKLSRSSIADIKTNIESNMKLILLKTDRLPAEVINRMEQYYDRT